MSFALLQMALFLFPANSFGHKASSPSGVLAFVIYQGGIAVKTKESSISLCKNHARTAILQLYMPLIDSNSYLRGQLNEDLKQYILMHIAINISKFSF